MMVSAGGIHRQTALVSVIGGLFVPASRVVVAAFQLSKLAQCIEPPGKQRPHREGAGQLHRLLEVSGGARFAAGQQNPAQVTGGEHHVDSRTGPPGDFDGLASMAAGRSQPAAGTFNLGHDRQRRAGPGGIAAQPSATAAAPGGARDHRPPVTAIAGTRANDPASIPGPDDQAGKPALAPKLATCTKIAMSLTMGYMPILML